MSGRPDWRMLHLFVQIVIECCTASGRGFPYRNWLAYWRNHCAIGEKSEVRHGQSPTTAYESSDGGFNNALGRLRTLELSHRQP